MLSSAASCVGLFVLGRQLNLRFPLLGVMIFSLIPLQFRYALEARPYSQALAITIWATVIFLWLARRLTAPRAVLYCLLITAGLYTQPYTLFVPLAHLIWAALPLYCRSRALPFVAGLCIVMAVLGFLPWYIYAKSLWTGSILSAHFEPGLGIKTPLMILRELVGFGYIGSLLILSVAFVGLRSNTGNSRKKLFLLCFLLPIFCVLGGDLLFSYFFAIRQIIFVLTPLSVLAALGIQTITAQSFRAGITLTLLLLAVLITGDLLFLAKPRENWLEAAMLLKQLNANGACSIYVPESSMEVYKFFNLRIHDYQCEENTGRLRAVALSISPYNAAQVREVRQKLIASGLEKTATYNQQGPIIEIYKRP